LQLSFNYIIIPSTQDNPITTFNSAITAIAISRFILNLRGIDSSGESYASNQFDSRIDQAIGNIGAPLNIAGELDDEEVNTVV